MVTPELDSLRLREALTLAESAIGLSEPNPRVGCVLARADGSVAGRGHTQRAGEAHAEIMALREAQAAGADLTGGTAWVSLEPCAHHGRTPPCCDALIAAGLARVVIAIGDPFPAVAGAGIARMRAAGLDVEMAGAEIAAAARELNIGFFSRIERGRPWVRLKMAASIDGYTALPDGRSQWITGPEARADGHAWRRRAGAVLTGIGTVLADDPRLDVREVPTAVQPWRVVLDSAGRLPADARVLQPPGPVVVVNATAIDAALPPHAERWLLPAAHGRIDLAALMPVLGARGINEVHVEAGACLAGALLSAQLVDECLIYLAPALLGQGRPMALMEARATLDGPAEWSYLDVRPIGPDLRIRLRRQVSKSLTVATHPDRGIRL